LEKKPIEGKEECVLMESKNPLDKSQELLLASFDEITALLTAIGHPNRFKILILLLKGPLTFQALLENTNLKKSALANHLTHLKDKSLVQKIQHGTYKITDDGRTYIQSIEAAYRESEARKKKIREVKKRQELARTFLERRQ
jgi:DNA-binding HxlR family transcriptional regulator